MAVSVKTLVNRCYDIDRSVAKKIRDIMIECERTSCRTDADITSALYAISPLIGGFGCEYVARGRNSRSPEIHYVNTGDMYSATILFVNGRFRCCCLGDVIEKGDY